MWPQVSENNESGRQASGIRAGVSRNLEVGLTGGKGVWGGLTSAATRPSPCRPHPGSGQHGVDPEEGLGEAVNLKRLRAPFYIPQARPHLGTRECRPATTPCSSISGPFLREFKVAKPTVVCAGGPGPGGTTVREEHECEGAFLCLLRPFLWALESCLLHCDPPRHLFQAAPLPGLLYLGEEVLSWSSRGCQSGRGSEGRPVVGLKRSAGWRADRTGGCTQILLHSHIHLPGMIC